MASCEVEGEWIEMDRRGGLDLDDFTVLSNPTYSIIILIFHVHLAIWSQDTHSPRGKEQMCSQPFKDQSHLKQKMVMREANVQTLSY